MPRVAFLTDLGAVRALVYFRVFVGIEKQKNQIKFENSKQNVDLF